MRSSPPKDVEVTTEIPFALLKSLEARAKRRQMTIIEFASDLLFQMLAVPTCRVCGCTQEDACCEDESEPCHWVERDLCSACVDKVPDKPRRRRASSA